MQLITKIRVLILFFVVALIVSGTTAFPLQSELKWLMQYREKMPGELANWLQSCYNAISVTNDRYPMLSYGYDWLAFAHIIIALSFIGPYRDPVKNIWIIEWQMVACIAVIPLAFIAGHIRQIPLFHILIDCSFGVLGIIPLFICRNWIKKLEKELKIE